MAKKCVFEKGKSCFALNHKECKKCPFRKSREEYQDSREKSRERISSLDWAVQEHIKRTYYKANTYKGVEV
jgi:hypothetical protein